MGDKVGRNMFRHQRNINPSLTWSSLLPDLQAATILGQRQEQGTFCSLCQGSHHSNTQCALASLHQPGSTPLTPSLKMNTQRYKVRHPDQLLQPVCTSWNMGACMFPGQCNFHMCVQLVHWCTEPRIMLTLQKNLYTGVAGDMGRD